MKLEEKLSFTSSGNHFHPPTPHYEISDDIIDLLIERLETADYHVDIENSKRIISYKFEGRGTVDNIPLSYRDFSGKNKTYGFVLNGKGIGYEFNITLNTVSRNLRESQAIGDYVDYERGVEGSIVVETPTRMLRPLLGDPAPDGMQVLKGLVETIEEFYRLGTRQDSDDN